ncbi:Protein of unknown function [Gryllus bimaculatus]|nr:Protein of unknown function [Gryllus bimaculatus]
MTPFGAPVVPLEHMTTAGPSRSAEASARKSAPPAGAGRRKASHSPVPRATGTTSAPGASAARTRPSARGAHSTTRGARMASRRTIKPAEQLHSGDLLSESVNRTCLEIAPARWCRRAPLTMGMMRGTEARELFSAW